MVGEPFALAPYDAEWPRRFEAERALLERILAPWLEGGIEHVGSTAIPGVAAKPIVDMVAGIRDLEEAHAAYGPLEAAGYIDEPHRPEIAHHFAKPMLELDARRFNLHLTEPSSSLWRERLAFRDALRADPSLAAEYEALKLRLAHEHLDVVRVSGRPRVVRSVFVGAGPHHMGLSPAGNELWVALGERARTIVVLDISDPMRPKVVGRFDPGFAAHDVAFSSDWRVWVTAADRRSVTIFDSRTLRPVARVAAGAPPQHVAFGPIRGAFVTSGYGSSLEIVNRFSGRVLRTVRVPYGSFNVATFGSFVVTSSLLRGTVTELTDEGHVWMNKRVAPAARGVAVATFP